VGISSHVHSDRNAWLHCLVPSERLARKSVLECGPGIIPLLCPVPLDPARAAIETERCPRSLPFVGASGEMNAPDHV
jgi:hypothetical protein